MGKEEKDGGRRRTKGIGERPRAGLARGG
jgi:hypothetical protein